MKILSDRLSSEWCFSNFDVRLMINSISEFITNTMNDEKNLSREDIYVRIRYYTKRPTNQRYLT